MIHELRMRQKCHTEVKLLHGEKGQGGRGEQAASDGLGNRRCCDHGKEWRGVGRGDTGTHEPGPVAEWNRVASIKVAVLRSRLAGMAEIAFRRSKRARTPAVDVERSSTPRGT